MVIDSPTATALDRSGQLVMSALPIYRMLCAECSARIEPLNLAETLDTPSRADTELCRRCYGRECDYVANRDYRWD